jgi:glycerol-3-phosphate dehydrogenase
MQRDLAALAGTPHDVLVVGGGIYGACAAWDAALRGLAVALIDRADFGSGTSANSLKIVHGGLRHLQRGDLRALRRSVRESSALRRIAPHLIRPLPFLVPTYSGSMLRGRAALALGLSLAELVGGGRDAFPRGRMLTRSECRERFPLFAAGGLSGGALWYEGQMACSERLTLSFVLSAAERGAVVANYVGARELLRQNGRVAGVRARDELSGEQLDVRARFVLDAAGPWGPLFDPPPPRPAGWAMAVNLVSRRRLGDVAVGVRSRRPPGRYLFLAPWRASTLIGTAYREFHGSPGELAVRAEDAQSLIDDCNEACPALELSLGDVSFHHRGLVPLQRGGQKLEVHETLRDHEGQPGYAGLLSLTGPKYTGARYAAERAVDRIVARLGRRADACRTEEVPIYGGESAPDETLEARLVRNHGSRASAVARQLQVTPGWSEPLYRGAPIACGELHHAVQEEMALTLADVVFRRTGLGGEAVPDRALLQAMAALMATRLGWSDSREQEELGRVLDAYRLGHGP